MKPARFDYHAPETVEEALELLDQFGGDAKVLAGGQSLMPMLNMRLSRPRVIIDINRLGSLEFIKVNERGGLSIGALARERAAERMSLVGERCPLLAATVPHIGHFQIRNRGTIGGSMAHADPAAELPALAVALNAEMVITNKAGQRSTPASEFFQTYFTTSLGPADLLTEVRLPAWQGYAGWGFEELARRQGDFAIAGAVAVVRKARNGVCDAASITLFGVGDKPVRATEAEARLRGGRVDEQALDDVARLVSEEVQPESDVHATAEFRKGVVGVLARRALEAASKRANARLA